MVRDPYASELTLTLTLTLTLALALTLTLTLTLSLTLTRYAIAYGSELTAVTTTAAPYTTRLFGEPLRLWRDANGVISCRGSAQDGAQYAVAEHQGLVYLWRGEG